MPRPPRTAVALALAGGLALAPVAVTPASAADTSHARGGHGGGGPGGHGRAVDTIALEPGSQPEGIAAGPGDRLFAGSRLDGAIYALRTDGSRRVLVPGSEDAAARGLQYDRPTRTIWVAGDLRDADGTTTGTVTQYDASSGAQLQQFLLTGTRFLNDVQITRDAVYVTDSLTAELVVVRDGSTTLLPLRGDWEQTEGINANGIRQLPGGDLVITQSSTGDLYRVDPRTGVADRIEVTGGDLKSGDGLELRGNTLYVVYGPGRNGISVVQLSSGGRHGTITGTLTDSDLDRPTTAVLTKGALYAVNGRFNTAPTATTPYDVVRVSLRRP